MLGAMFRIHSVVMLLFKLSTQSEWSVSKASLVAVLASHHNILDRLVIQCWS